MSWRDRARRSLPYLLAVVGGFVTAYLFVFFVVFPSKVIPDDASVPNVVGRPAANAAQVLERAGFRATNGEAHFHRSVPKDVVLSQDPPPGTRETRGTRVVLTVSAGQRAAQVPNVVGMLRQQAELVIFNAGFDLGDVSERRDTAARGQVLETRPRAGETATLPARVTLVLSGGPPSARVPDLVGRTVPEARAMLEQVGLRVGTTAADTSAGSAFQPPNTIVGQIPEAGRAVSAGARVNLTVVSPEPAPTQPPRQP